MSEGSAPQGGRGFRLPSREHSPLQAEAPGQTAASGMARGIINAPFSASAKLKALKRVHLARRAASRRNCDWMLIELQAETTMTTKLGRSLPISLRRISRPSLRRVIVYTSQRARGRLTGSEKRPKNNSFSERIVPRPSSYFSTGSSRMTRIRSFLSL